MVEHEQFLVVEDEVHLATARFNLEAEVTSYTAGDGESRSRFWKDSFDALVLDVICRGIDGFAVASSLRNPDNLFHLMLTLSAVPKTSPRLRCRADDYLPKPFELKDTHCTPPWSSSSR